MSDAAYALKNLKREKDFLVCIDSDGCAFDAMELKHKECFTPNTIKHWGLQAISKYARETAEFVNLYSQWRGANRFPALIKVIDLLSERPEVARRNFKLPDIESLRKWVEVEKNLSNPTLEAEVKRTGDPVLVRTLAWSNGVSESVRDMVKGVQVFPYVRESLEKIKSFADILVVSATPGEALSREWAECGLAGYMKVIAGQEMGTKKEHIAYAMAAGGYEKNNIIKIGDALGDYNAAKANDVHFFPINPGFEADSWKKFFEEAFDRFISGTYGGEYENMLLENFKKLLPVDPPWISRK